MHGMMLPQVHGSSPGRPGVSGRNQMQTQASKDDGSDGRTQTDMPCTFVVQPQEDELETVVCLILSNFIKMISDLK